MCVCEAYAIGPGASNIFFFSRLFPRLHLEMSPLLQAFGMSEGMIPKACGYSRKGKGRGDGLGSRILSPLGLQAGAPLL